MTVHRPKLFGIGMQRTGTTSLAEAARILGWTVCHGDYTRFPGALDLNDLIYQRYDMFCDTPFFTLYEKLDQNFPGSLFVLTLREEDRWVESVRRLFQVNGQFIRSPSIRLHHTLVYGASTFDEMRVRSAFRRHNARIKAYFVDRPGDLLCLDFSEGASWDELCSFVKCPRPNLPFPHLNKLPIPSK